MSLQRLLRRYFIPLFLISLLLTCAFQAVHLIRSDLTFTRLETEVSFWGRGSYTPTAVRRESTERGLARLVKGFAGHPDYLSLQASQLSWEAYWAENEEVRRRYDRHTLESQQLALDSRPAHRQSWVKMVEYASRNPQSVALLAIARDRVAELSAGTTH